MKLEYTVTHQEHELVNGLWVLRKVVPEGGRVLGTGQMCLRVSLLCVDEVWELGWVSKEEDRGVVVNPVHVTLISSKLDGECSRITSGIVRT